MKLISTHILFFGRAALIAIFVTSSGFTAILHQCVLQSMECCSEAETGDAGHCDETLPVQSQTSLNSPFACHTNTIVGGLAVTQGLVEKYSRLPHWDKTENIAVGTPDSFFPNRAGALHPKLFSRFEQSVSPPVEKYVLNASFLL